MAQASLAPLVNSAITVICNDGRVIIGTLRGFDQAVNLILSDCSERVFSGGAESGGGGESASGSGTGGGTGPELLPLGGLHVIRGDNVAVVGEVDAEREAGFDWSTKNAPPLPPVTH